MSPRTPFFFALLFCIGVSSANASSLFDIYTTTEPIVSSVKEEVHSVASFLPEKPTQVIRNFLPPENMSAQIDQRWKSWKLSASFCSLLSNPSDSQYCQEKLLKQKMEIGERITILKRRKMWTLTNDYCFQRSSFENYEYCLDQLHEQEKFCPHQKTSGTRIIIDLENQVLYGMKNCQVKIYSQITSGKNSTPTPTGEYHIYHRRGPHYMQNQWFVNKAFYYSGNYAIHDATWREGQYWRPENRGVYGSHGCTNTPTEMMEQIWEEFTVGDTVQVFHKLPSDIAWELQQKVGKRLPYNPEGED